MMRRLYRWRKRILVATAMLPVFQATTTCNPFEQNSTIVQQLSSSTVSLVYRSFIQTLATSFPSADSLQTLLGANPAPIINR